MEHEPFPAPNGFRWVFCAQFKHAKSGKIVRACDHGRRCFAFLVRAKKAGGK